MIHFDGTSTVATPTSSAGSPSASATASAISLTSCAFCAAVRPERMEPITNARFPAGSAPSPASEKNAWTNEGGAPVMSQWMRTISFAIC